MSKNSLFGLGSVLKLGIALGFAVSAAPSAMAGIAQVNLSPSQFVANCQRMGGTLTRPDGGGLSCKLPSGTTVSCSFNGDGSAFCNWGARLAEIDSRGLLGTKGDGTTKAPKNTVPGSDTLN